MHIRESITGFMCWGLALLMVCAGGCSSTPRERGTTTRPAGGTAKARDVNDFGPLAPPPGFDAHRAKLDLSKIPDDPPAPARPQSPPARELPEQARRRLEEAQRLFVEQRYTETILELEKALRYDPENPEAHRKMALACLLSGNEARARLSAERALAIQPDDLSSNYVMGRFAAKAGKADQALRYYRLALKCDSPETNGDYLILTRYHLGNLLIDSGYYAAALQQLEAFEAAVQLLGDKAADNPELATIVRVHRPALAIRMAKAHALLGHYPAAADALKTAVARSPKDLELRAEYIRMLVRAGRTEPAVNEATQFLADSQGNKDALELLLAVHRFAGHPERGVRAIREVIAKQPDNIDLRMLYADALLAAGRDAEAIQALNELIGKNPTHVGARWKLVELQRLRSDWPAWLANFSELLATQPIDYARISQELELIPNPAAQKLLKQNDGELSSGRSLKNRDEKPATSQPADAVASARCYLLARMCDRLERLDDARRLFERSAALNPKFVPAMIGAAEMYLQRGRWDDTVRLLSDAVKGGNEPLIELEILLGRAYDGLDDVDLAVDHYGKATQINNQDARPRIMLGKLYDRTGQALNADRWYQGAITVDARCMPAREWLIRNLLSRISPNAAANDQQASLSRALGELTEMQRSAPEHPATVRCSALVKFLTSREREPYLAALHKLIEEHPEDLQTREDLVKALIEFRGYATARTELGEMLARDPCSGGAHEMMATVLVKLLQFEEADEQFKRMIAIYPNREAWLRQWAELSVLRQDYNQAIELSRRLLSLKTIKGNIDRELPYRSQLIKSYRETRRFDEARKIAEGWLAQTGNDDRHRRVFRSFLLGIDSEAKDYERYVQRCREWLAANPGATDVRGWLQLGLIQTKRTDEAVLLGIEWLAEGPDDNNKLEWLVDVLQRGHRYDEAIELMKNQVAAAEKPEDRQARMGILANTYLQAKQYDKAIETVHELITQGQKQNAEMYVYELQKRLAQVLMTARRGEEAVRQLNAMLAELNEVLRKMLADAENDEQRAAAKAAVDQRRAELLRMQNLAYQRLGRMDLAEQRLREAYALAPSDIGINNDLGYTLADAGKNLDEARRMITLAVSEDHIAAYMDSYGWVLYKSGDFKEARTWLQRSTGVENGEDPVIYDHLGDALWRLGDKDAAVKAWKRSVEISDEQTSEGDEGMDKDMPERVKHKLEANASGKTPTVAPLAPKSRPAP